MAEVRDHLTPRVKIKSFADQRIHEIDEEIKRLGGDIRRLGAEKKMYKETIEILNFCPACNGWGKTKLFPEPDDIQTKPCGVCNGTGDRQE